MDIEKTEPPANGVNDPKSGGNVPVATGTEAIFTTELEGVFKENYEKAKGHLKNQQFEEAIAVFESSLKAAVEKFGQESHDLAIHYYNLGSAILSKIADSREVFAAEAPAKNNEDDEDSAIEEEPEEENKTESNTQQFEPALNPQPTATEPHKIVFNSEDNDVHKMVEIEDETAEYYKTAPKQPDNLIKQVSLENKEVPLKPKNKKVEAPVTTSAPNRENAKENVYEEPEDFQFAWDYLEIARVFTEKKLVQLKEEEKIDEMTKAMRFLAIIHIKLGDSNCYQGHYKEAVADYENCLKLRKFNEDPAYSRDIAEPYYLIAHAYLYIDTKEADDLALTHFHKCRVILENNLNKELGIESKKDPENLEDHKVLLRKDFLTPNVFDKPETKELKEILLEIYNKIDDTILQKNQRDLVNLEKEKARLHQEKTRELEKNFAKPLFENFNSASTQQGSQGPTLPSTFNYSLFNNTGEKPAENGANPQPQEQPKFVKLGVFGNAAKKRNREESTNNPSSQVTDIPSNTEATTHPTDPTSAHNDSSKDNGIVTQTDELGKPEKMTKPN